MGKHSKTRRPRVRTAFAAGLVGAGTLGSAGVGHAESAPAPAGAAPVAGTPCTAAARACVDLGAKKAWLIGDGKVVRGPVPMSSGGPGHETPRGDFRVEWKNKSHRSAEFNDAPMPFAVFFAPGGIAFHEGNLSTPSAGCVRLSTADASAFYDFLQVDDRVQVR
ncbi:L,D-transpeptidase [Pseudonocardia acidicola]|uniref:L,D-transpeptidase n=1 Tax=Pseudonocardia acidicola TaxID=2724939 RepID=A0ABX1SAB0_9PSEU|nr:L,D-transpeptidase [Pseudonocardia acidicola]NMH98499.1 L,D-transpeptidase [Pseudonocardia acidicola]